MANHPRRHRRRLRYEQLEGRQLLSANPLDCPDDTIVAEGEAPWQNVWHNAVMPEDVNGDNTVAPNDALRIINELNDVGARFLGEAAGEELPVPLPYLDVNNDRAVSAIDALQVVNLLNAEAEGGSDAEITVEDVRELLKRAAAASEGEDAIIAIVDRGGRILGVRAEQEVLEAYKVDAVDERTEEFVFAIDGAVAKARTAAFFANGEGDSVGPLTSRTVRFVSQSTVTQREVQSDPNITSIDSKHRGPGFVAPIGLGGHFPPEIPHTPPVDLFAIEHTNRDSLRHAGLDAIVDESVGSDDIEFDTRFGLPFVENIFAPESYGVDSERLPLARPRGIATLPGGIPLYKRTDPDAAFPKLVGGIGVFFPGERGFASYEQGFVANVGQTEAQRTNADKVLEAEWIAFAAACGSSGFGAGVGELDNISCPTGYDLPAGRIDLVGITLEIYGPNPTAQRPQRGVDTLLQVGRRVKEGDAHSGKDQVVAVGMDPVFHRAGITVPAEWLVPPSDSPLTDGMGDPVISEDDVRRIIKNAVDEAERVRAGIRLPIGERTKMIFSVADRDGNVLGVFRMRDATIFSIDVAIAKARNTAYYADPSELEAADRIDDNRDGMPDATVPAGAAFTNRTFRFLSEPRYPSGVEQSQPGAFSILRDPGINPLTAENIGDPLPASCYSAAPPDSCFAPGQPKIPTSVLGFDAFNPGRNFRDPGKSADDPDGPGTAANQNGIVFFPGSAPLYNQDGELIGGFGASGDGVDQDDVVTFAATAGFEPPNHLRADQFFVRDVRLPYQKFLRNPRG